MINSRRREASYKGRCIGIGSIGGMTYAAHSTKFTGELTNQQKLLDPDCTPVVLEQDCPTRYFLCRQSFTCN